MECSDELHEDLVDVANIQYVQVLLIVFFLFERALNLTIGGINVLDCMSITQMQKHIFMQLISAAFFDCYCQVCAM